VIEWLPLTDAPTDDGPLTAPWSQTFGTSDRIATALVKFKSDITGAFVFTVPVAVKTTVVLVTFPAKSLMEALHVWVPAFRFVTVATARWANR